MEEIRIDLKLLSKHELNINEYLILLDIVNDHKISSLFNYGIKELIQLEKKGFIKLTSSEIHLRAKSEELFNTNEDLFLKWLLEYPIKVNKKYGGTRALSPASEETILGKKLKNKWKAVFKGDKEKQEKAIKVLERHVQMLRASGDLEFMPEAHRWLNEGFHEKYEYLLEENESKSYNEEDFM